MDIPSAKSLIRRNIPFCLAGALLLLGMKYYYSRGGRTASHGFWPPPPGGSAPLAEFPS